jgi:hypothetical protein
MRFIQFKHEMLPRILLPLVGGMFVLAAMHSAARAEPTPAGAGGAGFIVSAADGYGVNECIKSGDECAKVVADAWCQAHGLGGARLFGPASDVTATIGKASAGKPAVGEDDVYISCRD